MDSDSSRPTAPSATDIDLPEPLHAACRRIEAQLGLITPRLEVVTEACNTLDQALPPQADSIHIQAIVHRLAPLLATSRGKAAAILLQWLASRLPDNPAPEEHAIALLACRDQALRRQALPQVLDTWEQRELPVSKSLANALACALDSNEERSFLHRVATLLGSHLDTADQASDPREVLLFHGPSDALRRLAARSLDTAGVPVPEWRLVRVLGPAAADRLGGLLQYTRATHQDLVDLTPDGPLTDTLVQQLGHALQTLGPTALGDVIGQLGWSAVSRGIAVEHRLGVSIDGSFPFLVTPDEAELLATCGTARRVWERRLVVAHGGANQTSSSTAAAETAEVGRFRRYNLLHADLLGEIMEIAPVTPAKVKRILTNLEEVIDHFTALFDNLVDNVEQIRRHFDSLRAPLLTHLEGRPDDQPLDAEITRLVQMFEDPHHVGEVTTLHGLKRFLHQHGLRLAFQRFRSGNAANRTVDLAVVAGDRVVQTLRKIRYIDFEPQTDPGALPFVVSLAVEALGRRLLHLHDDAPDLELLIYGNEVQAYVRFRNHPVFLRIDASPPLRGGMIDLEYFGVSQYELDHHPDLKLPWIQRIFKRLDFDAQADGLRLHIRYDKERAFDFGDLVDHVRLLCSLLPHLMDLDWVLGGLRYPEPVLAAVADHWADWIARWGMLPLRDMLTSDRRNLLQEVRSDASGTSMVLWNGQGEVRHRLSGGPGAEFWTRFEQVIGNLEPPPPVRWAAAREEVPAQLPLQHFVLDPWREQRLYGPNTSATRAPIRFAAMLEGGDDELVMAAHLAAVVSRVERHLHFATVGTIRGYPVQQATLLLPGEVLEIAALPDSEGVLRLATARWRPFLLTPGATQARPDQALVGRELDAEALATRLRRGNYVGITSIVPTMPAAVDLENLRRSFSLTNPQAPPPFYPGDRTLDGVAAAPGRASGRAVFYRPDLTPDDVDEAVLFAPTLRPEDTPLLRRAAAVVSTGGGILSHAGMIALELGKPALVVQGTWQLSNASRPALVCPTSDFTVEDCTEGEQPVTIYRNRRDREEVLRDGDLVVVNANRAKLGIMGQDRDALALQDELRHHDTVALALDHTEPGPQELALRGRLLRTAHQLEKLVTRIDQPNLARHAARELLAPRQRSTRSRRTDLLRRLFANPLCGEVAREAAIREEADLSIHLEAQCALSERAVDAAETIHEVVFLQRSIQRIAASLRAMRKSLLEANATCAPLVLIDCSDLEHRCHRRLKDLCQRHLAVLDEPDDQPDQWCRARTGLAAMASLALLLDEPMDSSRQRALQGRVHDLAEQACSRLARSPIIRPQDGGLELTTLIGAKGAGLGEIARVLGQTSVPAWFAVSDVGFREALATGIGPVDSSLRLSPGTPMVDAIQDLLQRPELDLSAKAAAIRLVWQSLMLPEPLATSIRQAYRDLAHPDDDDPANLSVAVRSSTFEEDSTRSSWAGQFDTFLCVRGADAVLDHIKLAWASLWSERVLDHRRGLGSSEAMEDVGGGVLVQRLINSRAAGVAHTLSPVSGQPREMVLNVGLGLGEGVVSGTVEVDQVVITRAPGDMPEKLQFRYTVGDKRHQVTYDRRQGRGTIIEETLYHQRLRPALEYTDLEDLIRAATRLEVAFGYPLDVEFALTGDRLAILQARPIVAYQEALESACEGRTMAPTRQEPRS